MTNKKSKRTKSSTKPSLKTMKTPVTSRTPEVELSDLCNPQRKKRENSTISSTVTTKKWMMRKSQRTQDMFRTPEEVLLDLPSKRPNSRTRMISMRTKKTLTKF